MRSTMVRLTIISFLTFLLGCQQKTAETTLFTRLPSSETGITFQNTLKEDASRNVLLYEYLYNGGGVAVGDFNGDGWEDVYFTANANPSKLYLNKKDFHFDDVTALAGVGGRAEGWRTGVTVVDINGDGRLDLYVCYSGPFSGAQRTHQLFVNQGNNAQGVPTFRDEAETYGLADQGFTTQAAFLDYDRDGDLDALLINHNPRRLDRLSEPMVRQMLSTPDSLRGIKLCRNDNGYFVNATAQSGLQNTLMSYALGVGVSDINGDGWPDIYVSSDYLTPDYLYLNNQRGGFIDQTGNALRHTAQFSMGNDIADVNNDARPDIMTLDMMPEDNKRQKMLFAPDKYEEFDMNVRLGFHPQFMRNMLQLNMGATGLVHGAGGITVPKPSAPSPLFKVPLFAEVGQFAGVPTTDWSWSPLLADYDNDGWKDLFITNGYLRDFTNMDFLKFMDNYFQERAGSLQKEDMIGVVEKMPASNVKNYAFRNRGNAQFENVAESWGLADPTNSNGAAYADFDNDGNLDLVVNNLNAEAGIYRNRGRAGAHYLRAKLNGNGENRLGIGAKVEVFTAGQRQLYEQNLSRGFQSSVSPVLHVGLGAAQRADSVRVTWPGGQQQRLLNVAANTTLTLNESQASQPASEKATPVVASSAIFASVPNVFLFVHQQPDGNDFKRQSLLINGLSYSGPCLAKGDVNGDGREDVFVGGAAGQPGLLFLQGSGGQFSGSNQPAFNADASSDDTDALFFDTDQDGDLDLYVCSGGYHQFAPDDALLQDRLYLNDGKGRFTKTPNALPSMPVSTHCVRAADVNGDGWLDLFVGGRVVPGRYPESPRSYLLINTGKSADGLPHFRDQTRQLNASLVRAGMITDAVWADINADGRPDLITVGDWMPIQIWINQNGRNLTDQTAAYLPGSYRGWWNTLLVTDLNNDGRPDILVGNQGLNGPVRASNRQPAELIYKDFDINGTLDPILCVYTQGKSYPFLSRDELMSQLPRQGKRFPDYKSFADAGLTAVFSAEELTGAGKLVANCLETKLFLSMSTGKMTDTPLPAEVQYAPVFAAVAHDFTGNGRLDLLLGGNITHARLRFGQLDASYGTLLKNDGRGRFAYVPQPQSGLSITGDIRSLLVLTDPSAPPTLVVGLNGQAVQTYRFWTR